MTNIIRQPFGGTAANQLTVLTKNAAASAAVQAVTRGIKNSLSFLRIATATRTKTLRLVIDSQLPYGSIFYLNSQSASSKLVLAKGFVPSGMVVTNKATAAKGTGNWSTSFIYNGTGFLPLGKPTRTRLATLVLR